MLQYKVTDDRGSFVFDGFTKYEGKSVASNQRLAVTYYKGQVEVWLTGKTNEAVIRLHGMFVQLYDEAPDKIVICDVIGEKSS